MSIEESSRPRPGAPYPLQVPEDATGEFTKEPEVAEGRAVKIGRALTLSLSVKQWADKKIVHGETETMNARSAGKIANLFLFCS